MGARPTAVKPGADIRTPAHDDLMQQTTRPGGGGMRVVETAVYRGPHLHGSQRGSSSCGAGSPMGFDSEEPFWKRKIVNAM